MALLELNNIYYNPDGVKVLNGVSIKIEKGTVSAFLGTPGSGKSTALKMIAGILLPTQGKVLFNGKDIFDMNRKETLAYRKQTGFMFQDSALWANQDIYHNFLLPLQTHFPNYSESKKKERIEEVTKLVGYNKPLTIRPAGLSIGEQKRVSFGRAIMCNPDVLFLDEPTESLDEDSVNIIHKVLHQFIDEGKTIVFVSHDAEFINDFRCDKYYYEKGTIVDRVLLDDSMMWDQED